MEGRAATLPEYLRDAKPDVRLGGLANNGAEALAGTATRLTRHLNRLSGAGIHFHARATAPVDMEKDLVRARRDGERYRLTALYLRNHLAVHHHLLTAQHVAIAAAFTPQDDLRSVTMGKRGGRIRRCGHVVTLAPV
jgi:hypothetical protein